MDLGQVAFKYVVNFVAEDFDDHGYYVYNGKFDIGLLDNEIINSAGLDEELESSFYEHFYVNAELGGDIAATKIEANDVVTYLNDGYKLITIFMYY